MRELSTPHEVIDLLRDMTGQSIVLSETIARRAGISASDLEVLGVIEQHGPLTAGRLSELTGLSPAAVTGLIDRLERAGVARRTADAADRRRVLVETAEGAGEIARHYRKLEADALRALRRRDQQDLELIADYLREMHELGVRHLKRLSSNSVEGRQNGPGLSR